MELVLATEKDEEKAPLITGEPSDKAPPVDAETAAFKKGWREALTVVLPVAVTVSVAITVIVCRTLGDDGALETAPVEDTASTIAPGDVVEHEADNSCNASNVLTASLFTTTFVNMSCAASNRTGDVCDAGLAEQYFSELFAGMRIEFMLLSYLSANALFSFAQLGGIPRPYAERGRCSVVGMAFWVCWMATQAAQWLMIVCRLAMRVAAHVHVRQRLKPCLLVGPSGGYRLDEFIWRTIPAQPIVVTEVVLLFLYSYLLSVGLNVLYGGRDDKATFKRRAANDEIANTVPITSVHYTATRWLLYAAALGSAHTASASYLITVALTLAAPAALAVAGAGMLLGARRLHGQHNKFVHGSSNLFVYKSKQHATLFFTERAYLRINRLRASGYLTLGVSGGLAAYALASPWLPAPTGLVVAIAWVLWQEGWLGQKSWSTKEFDTRDNMDRLHYDRGPSLTAPVWLVLNVAPLLVPLLGGVGLGFAPLSLVVILTVWSAPRAADGLLNTVLDSDADGKAIWADWCRAHLEGLPLVGGLIGSLPGPLRTLFGWLGATSSFDMLDGVAKRTSAPSTAAQTSLETLAGGLSSVWLTLALAGPVVYSAWFGFEVERPLGAKLWLAYEHSLDALLTLNLSWPSLLPSLTLLLETLKDPGAAIKAAVAYVTSMWEARDLAHYLKGVAAFGVLSFVFGLLKALAAYGRHAFAVLDTMNAGGGSAQAAVWTAAVHESTAPPKKAKDDGMISHLLAKCGIARADAEREGRLELVNLGLAAEEAPSLGLLVAGSPWLKGLVLTQNAIADEGGIAIGRGLATNRTLVTLELKGCDIGAAGGRAIGEALQLGISALTDLNLSENALCGVKRRQGTYDPSGIQAIAAALAGRSALKKVELSYNMIKDKGAIAIGECLKTNSTLETLELVKCGILAAGGKAIGEAIQFGTTTLTSLDLQENRLGVDGVKSIAEALKLNTTLTECTLIKNNLEVDSATMLAKIGTEKRIMLSGMKRDQTEATFYNEGLWPADVILIASDLLFMSALKKLNLDAFELNIEQLKGIDPVESIKLSNKGLGRASAIVIAKCIELNTTLTSVNVGGNNLDEEAALSIVRAARKHDRMTSLGLSQCGIGATGATEIAEYLNLSTALTVIECASRA